MKIILAFFAFAIILKICSMMLEQKGLYHPIRAIPQTPKDLGIKFEDVYFQTKDNQTLNGWFVPADGACVTLLYCHGNAGNIHNRLHKVKFFHDMGINFFIFDYRGYGKSGGTPNESGLYKDVQAAYDYLQQRKFAVTQKLVIYGKSLGGPVASDLCLHRKVAGLILEGSFASVVMRVQAIYPMLPMGLLISQKFDTLAKVKKIFVPKLIIHGKQDDVISFEHGERLFKYAAEPKQFLAFEGGHNDDVYVTSPQFKRELEKFLTTIDQ